MMKTNLPKYGAMAWFRRENWERLLAIFADSQVMPTSYDQGLEKANSLKRRLEALGAVVVQVDIDPATFPAWCRDRGLRVDAKAREEFASSTVLTMYFDPGGEH